MNELEEWEMRNGGVCGMYYVLVIGIWYCKFVGHKHMNVSLVCYLIEFTY